MEDILAKHIEQLLHELRKPDNKAHLGTYQNHWSYIILSCNLQAKDLFEVALSGLQSRESATKL